MPETIYYVWERGGVVHCTTRHPSLDEPYRLIRVTPDGAGAAATATKERAK